MDAGGLRGRCSLKTIDWREDRAGELIVSASQQVGEGEDLAPGVSLDHGERDRGPVESIAGVDQMARSSPAALAAPGPSGLPMG